MSENPTETDVVEESEVEELEESTETEDVEKEGENPESEADDEEEALYLDIDGEEVSLDQVKEWKSGSLMHSDYTRKTQALAEQRKATQTLADNLESSIAAIESLIDEDENSSDLEELLEVDPSEYLKRQNQMKAKRKKLEQAKKAQATALQEKTKQESEALVNLMGGEWSDKKAQDKDIKSCLDYAGKLGFTDADLNKLSDHRVYKALIDAAKYEQLKTNKPSVKKRKVTAMKKSAKKVAPKQSNEQKTLGQLLYGD